MNSAFVKLGDIADLTVGYVGNMTKEYKEEGIYFFRSLNIKPFYIDKTDLLYISSEFNEKIKKSKLKEGDLVIVRTGQPGTCCVIPKEYDGCNCSDLVIVRPNQELVNPYYLEAYVNFMAQKQINHHQVGAIQKHFNVGSAKEMLVFLPNRDKQERIANLVRNINSKIENNNKINTELESMAKTIYDYWFLQFEFPNEEGKPYKSSGGKMVWNEELKREIPEGWEVLKVSDITNVVTGKEDANFAVENGAYKFFTCSQDILLCNEYSFEGSAVLIAGNGDFNVKHYTGKFNAYQRTYVLVPREKELYGSLYITAKEKIDYLKAGANGSIVKFITKGDVEQITMLKPRNDNLFDTINKFIEKIEIIQKENEELASLRDFLLPILMNGQVGFKE